MTRSHAMRLAERIDELIKVRCGTHQTDECGISGYDEKEARPIIDDLTELLMDIEEETPE